MPGLRSLAGLALIAVALAACLGDATVIYREYYNSAYTPAHVTLAAANNPAQAVVRNSPFAADRDNAGVIAAMQGRNWGPPIYFAPRPRADDKYGYRVVVDFAPGLATGYTLCRAPAEPTSPQAPAAPLKEIGLVAAFCVSDVLLTEAAGRVPVVSGPDDPRFRGLMAQVMLALTPPNNPNIDRDRCIGPGC